MLSIALGLLIVGCFASDRLVSWLVGSARFNYWQPALTRNSLTHSTIDSAASPVVNSGIALALSMAFSDPSRSE